VQVWIEAPPSADRCDNITVTVNISQVDDLDSASYDVTYDPDIMQVVGVSNGSVGGTEVPVSDWGFIPEGVQGTVRIINNIGGAGGISGAGTLAVIDFSVSCANCGNTTIDFSGEQVVYDNESVEIDSEWAGDWTNVSCAAPTPSPTATTTATATATASATPSPSPTPTESPTPPPFVPWVHFAQPSYSVSPETNSFYTMVELNASDNVSTIEYFWGAQFDVVYNYSLITSRALAAQPGSLWDADNLEWNQADYLSVAKVGPGPDREGRIRVQVTWEDYPVNNGSKGINTTGGTLVNLRWRSTANTGVSDLNFSGTRILAGYGPPPEVEWAYTGVLWTNSSVTVE
jgi:hypothetical protein